MVELSFGTRNVLSFTRRAKCPNIQRQSSHYLIPLRRLPEDAAALEMEDTQGMQGIQFNRLLRLIVQVKSCSYFMSIYSNYQILWLPQDTTKK